METANLKRFAQQARRSLHDQVTSRLKFVLSPESAARREHPVAVQKLEEAIKKDGKPAVIDQVAYTWFNRFCALRFMDANRYNGTNIVSPAEVGQYQPEILAEAKLGHIDDKLVDETVQQKVNRLLSGADPSRDSQAEAYRLLLVSVCNYWNRAMPFLFQRIDDYTELLLPDDLLSENSILTQTREALIDKACQDVEVIGWLYQFYISEKKDEVMARKSAVPTEDIPAVTQLFTPHWIVRYLVENSLGRLWLLNRPGSRIAEQMEYYIKSEEPETDYLRIDSVEDIKVCDPACGSGHMLTYAFDLLYAMYEEEGYAAPEIPKLILSKNLFGIDIDDRAGELAAFALSMKARAKDRRLFIRDVIPQITVLKEIKFDQAELSDYRRHFNDNTLFTPDVLNLLVQFENAKTFGSLIQPVLSQQKIKALRAAIVAKEPIGDLYLSDTHLKVHCLLEQAEALTQRYHVVVTNPPYMGKTGLNGMLVRFLLTSYESTKYDLFSAFMARSLTLAKPQAFCGFMTPNVWMYISSYEQLRRLFGTVFNLCSLVELAPEGFSGASVQVCFFVIQPGRSTQESIIFDLSSSGGNEAILKDKLKAAAKEQESSSKHILDFSACESIPKCTFTYSCPSEILDLFAKNPAISEMIKPITGLQSNDNTRFVRYWFEVDYSKINRTWARLNNGGRNRKWYGNLDSVIFWENNGQAIREFSKGAIRNEQYFGQEGLTWNRIGNRFVAVRYLPNGLIIDQSGDSAFPLRSNVLYSVIGYLNSSLGIILGNVINPTLNFTSGNMGNFPSPMFTEESAELITRCVSSLITISKRDWDDFEISWDFSSNPVLASQPSSTSFSARYQKLRETWDSLIGEYVALETTIDNEIWSTQCKIDTSKVSILERTVTLNHCFEFRYSSDTVSEERQSRLITDTVREFISYAVGCMFGRYAIDEPGIILAKQGETLQDYLKRVPEPSFPADEDNVIPVLDGEWFSDDIVARFRTFLRITFGDGSFVENLRFIETALGTEAKPKSIRDYFVKDFYNDHIKLYKKRPIYWMFTSPKGTFNALIYMHRYRPDTISIVLNGYLREFRTKLVAHKAHLEAVSISAGSSQADKTKAMKEIEKIAKAIVELEDYERDVLYPLATEQLSIDLDDGVKVNYLKFGSALKKIPGLEAKED